MLPATIWDSAWSHERPRRGRNGPGGTAGLHSPRHSSSIPQHCSAAWPSFMGFFISREIPPSFFHPLDNPAIMLALLA